MVGRTGSSSCKEMLEVRVRSWGQEDLLEEEMTTHSSIFVGKIPWTEEPGVTKSWPPLSEHTHISSCYLRTRHFGIEARSVQLYYHTWT